jgi:hypothetical protein
MGPVNAAFSLVYGEKYSLGSFIYVANDRSIMQQKATDNDEPMQPGKKSEASWVAYILEIRASDTDHVYARIYWMYWPEELPRSHDGRRSIQGRQSYHGMHELIASNHSMQF